MQVRTRRQESWWLPLAFFATFAVASSAGALSGSELDALGDRISGHVLSPLVGEPLTVDELRGEVVVVSFWATWCKPCHRELAVLDELHARVAPLGARVLAVSIDRDRGRVERFVEERGLSLPVFHDGPDDLIAALDVDAFPFTIVIGRNGRAVFASHDTSDEALAEFAQRVDDLASASPTRVAEGSTR